MWFRSKGIRWSACIVWRLLERKTAIFITNLYNFHASNSSICIKLKAFTGLQLTAFGESRLRYSPIVVWPWPPVCTTLATAWSSPSSDSDWQDWGTTCRPRCVSQWCSSTSLASTRPSQADCACPSWEVSGIHTWGRSGDITFSGTTSPLSFSVVNDLLTTFFIAYVCFVFLFAFCLSSFFFWILSLNFPTRWWSNYIFFDYLTSVEQLKSAAIWC